MIWRLLQPIKPNMGIPDSVLIESARRDLRAGERAIAVCALALASQYLSNGHSKTRETAGYASRSADCIRTYPGSCAL